ncbi:hypothetical protein Q604_UNBC04279G0001, partial [human gut metagenome]
AHEIYNDRKPYIASNAVRYFSHQKNAQSLKVIKKPFSRQMIQIQLSQAGGRVPPFVVFETKGQTII